MNSTAKLSIVFLFFLVIGCGGSSGSGDSSINVRRFAGTVTGTGCITNREVEAALDIILSIDEFEEGADIEVADESGMEWRGTMLSSSSFIAIDDEDDDEQLFGDTLTPSSMNASLITCVIEECCFTLTGRLNRP